MATIRNTTIDQKLNITKVVMENDGVWHTNLTTPNILLGAWIIEVELENLMVITDPLLGLDVSIEMRIVSINTKDYDIWTWCWASPH